MAMNDNDKKTIAVGTVCRLLYNDNEATALYLSPAGFDSEDPDNTGFSHEPRMGQVVEGLQRRRLERLHPPRVGQRLKTRARSRHGMVRREILRRAMIACPSKHRAGCAVR